MKRFLLALALGALAFGPAAAASTSVTGTLVNIAGYVTGDASATTFNMGAMMGSAGRYGGMNNAGMNNSGMMNTGSRGQGMYGQGMNGQGMNACRSALGIVTSGGEVYLLAVDSPSFNVYNLCSRIGSRTTVTGSIFRKGGIRVIRVESFRQGS